MLWETGVKYKERCIDTREKLDVLRQNNCLMFQQLPLLEIARWVEVGSVSCYCMLNIIKNSMDNIHCDMLADGIKDLLRKIYSQISLPD